MQIVDEKKIDDEIFKTLPIRQIAKQKKNPKKKGPQYRDLGPSLQRKQKGKKPWHGGLSPGIQEKMITKKSA